MNKKIGYAASISILKRNLDSLIRRSDNIKGEFKNHLIKARQELD